MSKTSSKYTAPIEAILPPGETIVSGYSELVTGVPTYADASYPTSVTIDRLWSGIEIVWDLASLGFTDIKIIRKQRDYAHDLNDGLVVYEGDASAGIFKDTTATGTEVYYYVLWFRNTPVEPWSTKYWLRVWEICLAPNDVPELLWRLLPMMYRQTEEQRDNSDDLQLHVNKIIAPVIREIEDLTDFFPSLMNVDETPGPILKSIAQYVGLVPNLELTYTQQREEIKAAVSSYKKKGLKSTLERMAQAISGLVAEVVDWNQRLLVTNWKGKKRLSITQAAGYVRRTPSDQEFRRLGISGGGLFDTATYGLYLTVPPDRTLGQQTVRKLYRALQNFAPVYMEMDLWVLLEIPPTEQFGIIGETSWIEVEGSGVDDFTPQNFLTRNTPGSTTNTQDIVKLISWPEEVSLEETS